MQKTSVKTGVHFARTSDGRELPIVDVTHPAFALEISDEQQQALVEKFMTEGRPLASLPKPLRNLALRFFLRGSVLAQGIRQSQGTFMTGLSTYLLKLGPEMLTSVSDKPIDRRIATALPALAVRLRLQDMAQLMADILFPALLTEPRRALHFINIAGGPAIDSLNALLLLQKKDPVILARRETTIHVLDQDNMGPEFGAAALASLSQEAAPLHGVRVNFRHIGYDWRNARDLQPSLDEAHSARAVAICSSEGGLFEYGSDRNIEANLKILRTCPEVQAVVGSVTRNDSPIQLLHETSRAATRPRGLDAFRTIAQDSGWDISKAIQRPFSDQVVLI